MSTIQNLFYYCNFSLCTILLIKLLFSRVLSLQYFELFGCFIINMISNPYLTLLIAFNKTSRNISKNEGKHWPISATMMMIAKSILQSTMLVNDSLSLQFITLCLLLAIDISLVRAYIFPVVVQLSVSYRRCRYPFLSKRSDHACTRVVSSIASRCILSQCDDNSITPVKLLQVHAKYCCLLLASLHLQNLSSD